MSQRLIFIITCNFSYQRYLLKFLLKFVLCLVLHLGVQHVKTLRRFGMTLDHGLTISRSKLQKLMLLKIQAFQEGTFLVLFLFFTLGKFNELYIFRFFVTALPTIFHVSNGEFRRYSGSRDMNSFMSFVEEKKWKNIEKVEGWKSPDGVMMSILSWFFKLSHFLKVKLRQ